MQYDLVVIGGGSGGLTATHIAARLGARVLLVDRQTLGGDCLHTGCVPSKALIASARLAHLMRRASDFGLGSVEVKVDLGAVMRRIRDIQSTIGGYDSADALRAKGAAVELGGARFVDAHTVEVGGAERVSARHVIVATGSRAEAPPIPGLKETGYLDHASLFQLERLPSRIAVLGGGPIGCEMAQALRRLGAEVVLLQRAARLLEREDPEVADHLAGVFAEEGIDVRRGAVVESVSRDGGDKLVHVAQAGARTQVRVDEILVAVGRRPALESLDLAAAGIEANAKGIVVDPHLRTSQRHIFAVGDCNGGPQFTHWAEYEARIATRNALFVGRGSRSTRVIPWITFTDPEVARVGLTEAEARERGHRVEVHRFDFDHVDRALTEGEPGGFIKVVVDGAGRVLGAHLVGHAAGEALGEWVLAMEHPRALRLQDIGAAIHAYPTFARINRRVADESFLAHGVPRWVVRLAGRFRARPAAD